MKRDFDPTKNTLDAWLDGELDDAARLRFERELRADPDLSAEADLGRAIDDSLRRSFMPPALDELCREVEQRANAKSARTWSLRSTMILATAAAALAILFWPRDDAGDADPSDSDSTASVDVADIIGVPGAGNTEYGSDPTVSAVNDRGIFDGCTSLDELGYELADHDDPFAIQRAATWQSVFESARTASPAMSCGDGLSSFEADCATRFGTKLSLGNDPKLHVSGLRSSPELGSTGCVLVNVEDSTSMLFIDRLATDPRPAQPADENLRLFRRVLAPLVLYEMTPALAPSLLQRAVLHP